MWRSSVRRVGRFLVTLSMLAAAFSAVHASESDQPRFGVSLVTDKPVYARGDPVHMSFEVSNPGATAVTLQFTSAQRFDLVIEDEAGRDVWRWSAGRLFAAVLGEEVFHTDSPRLAYEAIFSGVLDAGAYRIRAWITDGSGDFSATLGIQVQ